MDTITGQHITSHTPIEQQSPPSLISDVILIREITALAKAEHRRHRIACATASITVDELVSEGWLASQKALRNFDPEKGHLLHYLRRYVKRELAEAVRVTKVGPVSVSPRTVKRLERGELSPESTAVLRGLSQRDTIVVGSHTDNDPVARGQVFEADVNLSTEESTEDVYLKRDEARALHALVGQLRAKNGRHAEAVTLIYGLDGTPGRTYEEVALIMGVTVANLTKIHTRAMTTLRSFTQAPLV